MLNSPIRFSDPTGHWEDEGCGSGDLCQLPPDATEKLRRDLEDFEQPDAVDEDEMITVGFIITDQIAPDEYVLLQDENGRLDYWLLWRMYQIQQNAFTTTGELFPNMRTHNDPADAFRHAYWNALMTREYGVDFTRAFTTAHETGYAPYPNREEVFMDLHNNQIGRDIAISSPNASDEYLQQLVMDALHNGRLYVWDGNNIYFSNTCPMCSPP